MNPGLDREQVLQLCLEQTLSGKMTIDQALQPYPQFSDELRPLLESAIWLQAQRPNLQLADRRKQAVRQRLMAVIREKQPSRAVRPARQRRFSFPLFIRRQRAWAWMAIILTLCLAFTSLGSGVALAAQTSLPGDGLYPVKIVVENLRLAATVDPNQKSQLLFEDSSRRLEEAQTLDRIGRYEDISIALNIYETQVSLALQAAQQGYATVPAKAKALSVEWQRRLEQQTQALAALAEQAPVEELPAVQRALEVSQGAAAQLLADAGIPASSLTPSATLPEVDQNAPIGVKELPSLTPTSFVPPGQLKITQTALITPPGSTSPPTIKPTKTPKPPNTHKPPTEPKPTKKHTP